MSSSKESPSPAQQQTDPYYACSRRAVFPQQQPAAVVLKGLFTFPVSATILRMADARGELDAAASDDGHANNTLTHFFDRLVAMECDLEKKQRTNNGKEATTTDTTSSLIVVVEGLDGSGKSTLVRELATQQSNVVCWSTPSQTLSDVRPVFDKCGGAVARAFYMVSNYILQYEIQEYDKLHQPQQSDAGNSCHAMTVHIVDRWVTSTIAYSVAWNFLDIDALPAPAFGWPHDVRPPDLLLILQIDDEVRRERVHLRNACSRHNPWDQRLDQDASLGRRIVRSFERVGEELSAYNGAARVACLNANASPQDVLMQAVHEISATKTALQRHQAATPPLQHHYQRTDPSVLVSPYHRNPLQFFRQVSSELQLCDGMTGRRSKHALWTLQVAWNDPTKSLNDDGSRPTPPPLMKTVGIQVVDATGILYCTRRDENTTMTTASVVWCGGQYPFEQQWRAEGFLVPMIADEQPPPPPSLVAYVAACCEVDTVYLDTNTHVEKLNELAAKFRSNTPTNWSNLISWNRFVPLNMEVLIGGPSSPDGGPRRYEWTRGVNQIGSENRPQHQGAEEEGVDDDKYDDATGWSVARSIVPFRPAGATVSTRAFQQQLSGITVALTGTHCSGKATLGRALAKRLGWSFHGELGDELRNPVEVTIPAGYKAGYSSGSDSWDEQIFNAEVARDQWPYGDDGVPTNRIVETWHVGNVGWAKIRLDAKVQSEDRSNTAKQKLSLEDHYQRAKGAIQEEMTLRRRCILAVHVSMSAEDTVRRRQCDTANRARLPIEASIEVDECNQMHEALDVGARAYWKRLQRELSGDCRLQVLVLDNSEDGANAIDAAVRKIVAFINEQQWRRAF